MQFKSNLDKKSIQDPKFTYNLYLNAQIRYIICFWRSLKSKKKLIILQGLFPLKYSQFLKPYALQEQYSNFVNNNFFQSVVFYAFKWHRLVQFWPLNTNMTFAAVF